MTIRNILIVTDAPSPYKMDFLTMVEPYHHLHILFLNSTLNDRDPRWFASMETLSHMVLPSNKVKQIHYGLTMDISKYDLFWNMNYLSPVSIVLAKRFRKMHKPVLMHADGGIHKNRGWIMNHLIRFFLNRNDYFTSSGLLNDQYYAFYGIEKSRIFHYHFSSIHQKEVRGQTKHLDGHPIKLLSVGQPIYRKGFDLLLKALVPFEDKGLFHLTIVGGKPNEQCQQILNQNPRLQDIVDFLPFVEKHELAKYYNDADYFVFPTREDIWGLVINEALAYGLPIISTDQCAAMVEISRWYAIGQTIKSDDVQALSDALATLESDSEFEKKSSHALLAANEYSMETMLLDYLNIFERLGKVA